MKKKIYFVGFAGEELASLQAVLARLAGVWDCEFFPEGGKALSALDAGPVDAVVASAGKGSTAGAEFMQQAAARQPGALRFVVGDVASQESIISCIGATHQFISKPCKPQDLVWTIQRGLALDACISSDEIRALTPKLRRLPSLPSTYFEVLKQVESSSATVQGVGEVIMRDPAMTARLLQMVNSAAFALAQKVTDPVDAVSLLGMETVKSLVLCLQVFSAHDAAKESGLSLDRLWDHSLTVGKLAREIALCQTSNSALANEAFTAGLLHDVGRIVIASNLPKEYAETVKLAKEQARPLYLQEAAQFGVDHAQVGAYLLGLWGMPAALVEAAALHHTPSRTPAHEFSPLTAVHVANVFAHEQEGDQSEFVRPQLDPNYLNALGLHGKEEVWKKLLANGALPAEELRKEIKREEAAATKAAKAPAPVESASEGVSLLNFLVPSAAVVTIVASIFLWQYTHQSGEVVRALANPDNTTTNPVALTTAPATPPEPVVAVNPAGTANPVNQTNAVSAPVPVVPKAESEPAAAPTQQVAQVPKPVAAPVVLKGFDSIKLEGVLVSDGGSSAIFNGKTLAVGQRINDILVEAIDSAGVTMEYNGQEKVYKVK